jgi:hypothetical protein
MSRYVKICQDMSRYVLHVQERQENSIIVIHYRRKNMETHERNKLSPRHFMQKCRAILIGGHQHIEVATHLMLRGNDWETMTYGEIYRFTFANGDISCIASSESCRMSAYEADRLTAAGLTEWLGKYMEVLSTVQPLRCAKLWWLWWLPAPSIFHWFYLIMNHETTRHWSAAQ